MQKKIFSLLIVLLFLFILLSGCITGDGDRTGTKNNSSDVSKDDSVSGDSLTPPPLPEDEEVGELPFKSD